MSVEELDCENQLIRFGSVDSTLYNGEPIKHHGTFKKNMKHFKKVFAKLVYRHLDFVRLFLSIACCTLYIAQTQLDFEEFSYPNYCCGVAKSTTQPCLLNSFTNGTVGWALKQAGCIHVEKVTKVPMGINSEYAFANSTKVDFSDLTDGQVCQRYCSNGVGCKSDVRESCYCASECGDTLYCSVFKDEHCEDWDYMRLLFYEKPIWLYFIQVACSILVMAYAIIRAFAAYYYRGVRVYSLIEWTLFIDCFNGIISLASLAFVPCLKDLYIPLFLQCFTARVIITNILYSLDVAYISSKFLTPVIQKVTSAVLGLAALLFAFTCVVHYFERVICTSDSHVNTLFDSIWFIIVTITTVGYGDKSPGTPLGRLSVIFLILIILFFLPTTLTGILELINDSKQDYKFYHCHTPKRHVVLCVCKLDFILINDFLNEFYSQEENMSLNTVVLTGEAVTPAVKILLKGPPWRNKILVIIGSALNERDLERASLRLAKACFLLSDRITEDARMSDNETMLRASLIQSYAPHIELYVHIFMAENRMNVNFAKQVLCEGRLKQVLMANNCIYPGLSSLITILLHTSSSEKCSDHKDNSQLYTYCSANEIYAIKLKDSSLFSLLAGRTFLCASIFMQRTTEVLLFAVKPANKDNILLNPGRRHTLNEDDTLYYIATDPEKTVYEEKQITPEDLEININKIIRTNSEASFYYGRDSETDHILKMGEDFEILDTSCTPLNPPPGFALLPLTEEKSENPQDTIDNKNTKYTKDSTPTPDTDSPVHIRKFKNVSDFDKPAKTPLGNESKTPHNYFKRQASRLLDDNKQKTQLKGLDKSGEEKNVLTDLVKKQESETTNISLNHRPTYFWVKETVLHLNKAAPSLCCLQAGWKMQCHEKMSNAVKKIELPEERNVERMLFLTGFKRPLIVCANEAGSQLYEFLLPLRAYHIPTEDLIPIVLLLPNIPDNAFLEAITWIPYIKFIVGRPECIDDLLIAGALDAEGVIICYGDAMPELKEEVHMADASRISTARNMSHIFANTKFYVELTEIWSLKYLKLEGGCASHPSKSEMNSSWYQSPSTRRDVMEFFHAPYFVSSQAFAPSLLDTLLYQCMQKDYILDLVHLLLGLHQTPGSGYIGKVEVKQSDLESFQSYGQFMLDLAVTHSQLALAIYRTTEDTNCNANNSESEDSTTDPSNTEFFLRRRVLLLGIPYDISTLKRNRNAEKYHILVNPPADTPLMPRDIVLVINSCSAEQYKIVHHSYSDVDLSAIYPSTDIIESLLSTDNEIEQKPFCIPILKKQSVTSSKPPSKCLNKQQKRKSSAGLLGTIGLEKPNPQSGNKYLKKANSRKNLPQLQIISSYPAEKGSIEMSDNSLGDDFEGTDSI